MSAARVKGSPRPPRETREAVELVDRFAILDDTHRELMLQLTWLQQLLADLNGYEIPEVDRAIARQALKFFNENARQHHAEEEARVFPQLLQSSDATLVHQVQRLQQDHGWLEEDWLELGPMLADLAEGHVGVDLDSLRHALEVFTTLYHEHVSLEESLIYPAAKRQQAADEAARARRLAAPA
ncbi:hemerythrin domain-containing protein [Paucibacter sp. APW11]|uniref:Hemerythrin domain-containing protein n=1 Tax=Roseateles aquae TaxID=3077235 RepID=A0ABU3PCR7_9BURK|nr:hemerythrin domain-containing protein [Paucibacter sp. APW11]MDT9000333.1 hemerythrin domain-containing protein [Paucibacter sp. APW11]